MEFQKINTLFKRDANNISIPTSYTSPEFEYLANCKWECTEKIDGTNTRVELSSKNGKFTMDFKGRTDRALLPSKLVERMYQLFSLNELVEAFSLNKNIESDVTIYGEGYGKNIQAGGNYIPNGVDFRLIAIKVDNWWLRRDTLEEIAAKLGIEITPLIGYMTIPEAVDFVKKGFKSTIAENKDYNAEGLVLTTPDGLLFRNGERIMTKIKTMDFIKYHNKYGDTIVEQPVNPKYDQ